MTDDELIKKWKSLKEANPDRILLIHCEGNLKGIIKARVFYREKGKENSLWEWPPKKI